MAAAKNGHLEIVRALIEAGANPHLHIGVSQGTAEFYARQNGHTEVSKYLSQVMGI
jgi:ankyrin repeat protein